MHIVLTSKYTSSLCINRYPPLTVCLFLLLCQSSVEAPRHRKQRGRSSDGGGGPAPLLALGTPAGSVLVYSVLAGDLQTELSGAHGSAGVHCLAWDPAGQHVFSGAADGNVVQWALKNGKVKWWVFSEWSVLDLLLLTLLLEARAGAKWFRCRALKGNNPPLTCGFKLR